MIENKNRYYGKEVLKYFSIMIIEKYFLYLGDEIKVDGFFLKMQIFKNISKADDIGELEIVKYEYEKGLMEIKIKIFSIKNKPQTAIEVGKIITSTKDYNEIHSIVTLYDFTDN